jgi:TonB family protein
MTQVAWLGEIAWKGTVILTASCAAAALLFRASAAARHFLWTAAMAALLLLPAVITVAPHWKVETRMAAGVNLPRTAPASGTLLTVRPDARKPFSFPWLSLWVLGCALTAGRFAFGAARVRRILRLAEPANYARQMSDQLAGALRLRRRLRVLEAADVPVPLACGLLQPAIVLPSGASAWPQARLRTVLRHELEHIRRYDLGAQALGQAACCIYWFHPLAWIAARQLRQERERACDDAVLASGAAAYDYAADLVDLARGLADRRRDWSSAPAMAEACDLESRVRALFDPKRNRRPLRARTAAAIGSAAIALLLPTAALTLRAQAPRGALAGVVQDASGARIPKCRVVAKGANGNQEVTTVNAAGEYSLAGIPAGDYVLEFSAPGFALKKMEAAVTPDQAVRVDASLEMGSVMEAITVRGQKPPTIVPKAAQAPQRVRVGGNVQPVRLLHQAKPQYPTELQQLGVEGTVVMRGVISKEGNVLSAKVINTVDPRLAQLALDAFQQWRYQPSLLNGEPVETQTTVTIDFTLN